MGIRAIFPEFTVPCVIEVFAPLSLVVVVRDTKNFHVDIARKRLHHRLMLKPSYIILGPEFMFSMSKMTFVSDGALSTHLKVLA
jgi:hypothetical protein